jgi:hypothetical protein
MVHGAYELMVRLSAVLIGLLFARGMGLESVLLYCVGLIISPFLVIPIWRMAAAMMRPRLVPSFAALTTLDLGK